MIQRVMTIQTHRSCDSEGYNNTHAHTHTYHVIQRAMAIYIYIHTHRDHVIQRAMINTTNVSTYINLLERKPVEDYLHTNGLPWLT